MRSLFLAAVVGACMAATPALAQLSASTTVIDFGIVALGSSATQSVTLTNDGGLPAEFTEITAQPSAFSASTDCSILNPAETCQVQVTFSPTVGGTQSGSLEVRYLLDGTQQQIIVSLTGSSPKPSGTVSQTINQSSSGTQSNVSIQTNMNKLPDVRVEPAYLDFGSVQLSTTATHSFVIANDAPNALPAKVKAITVGGDFAVSSCPTTLYPGQSCEVQVDFTPTRGGLQKETVEVALSIFGFHKDKHVVVLGTTPLALSFDRNLVDFGQIEVGSSSSAVVTLTNTGTSFPADIQDISVSGSFASISACPASLNPGEACQIQVDFLPTEPGKYVRQLTVKYLVNGAQETLQLTAKGVALTSGS